MKTIFAFVLALLFVTFTAPLANAQVILVGCSATVFGNPMTSRLVDVNVSDGSTSNIRDIGIQYMGGITTQPSTGIVFGLTTFVSSPANSLVSINLPTGTPTFIGMTGMDIVEGDLAFNPIDGLLYGVKDLGFNGLQRNLFRINPASGVSTIVGNTMSTGDLSALAFDNTGTLFAIDSAGTGNSLLQTINKETGVITSSISMNFDLGSAVGLAFHPLTGQAFVADGGDSSASNLLFSMDSLTGNLTPIGSTSVSGGLSGLTFVTVPEPTSAAFVLIAVSTFGFRVVKNRFSSRTVRNRSPMLKNPV